MNFFKTEMIVTAFLTDVNTISFRSRETYLELGKKLLSAVPTICFLERHILATIDAAAFPLCTFVSFEKEEMYLYAYRGISLDVHTDNPGKDTVEYLFVQCYKTEFLRRATEINASADFTWVDFGIFHMIGDEEEFRRGIAQLCTKSYDKVRIASCIDPRDSCHVDIYRNVVWFFAGSVVGGNRNSLQIFADRMKAKCLALLSENRIMWEINIWYLLYQENADIFEPYRANHNVSILMNY